MIQREISRVLVLNLFWHTLRCSDTALHTCVLDNAFALIEGHPPWDGGGPGGWNGCPDALIGDLCFPDPPGINRDPIVPPERSGGGGSAGGGGSTSSTGGGTGTGNGERLGIPGGLPLPRGNVLDC